MLAIGLALAVGVGFGLRSADPLLADPALRARLERQAMEQASAAEEALVELDRAFNAASDGVRQGSTAMGSGTDPPGPYFTGAAEAVAQAADARTEAERQLIRLSRSLARLGDAAAPLLAWSAADHLSLEDQLTDAAPAADVFVTIRLASDEAIRQLGRAAAAINRSDLDAASAALDEAEEAVAVVALAADRLDTLPVWIETADALILAAREIIAASEAGDPDALAEAQAAYAEAAVAASLADRALAIALAEGSSAVTSPAQASLGVARRAVADARAGLIGLSILP